MLHFGLANLLTQQKIIFASTICTLTQGVPLIIQGVSTSCEQSPPVYVDMVLVLTTIQPILRQMKGSGPSYSQPICYLTNVYLMKKVVGSDENKLID